MSFRNRPYARLPITNNADRYMVESVPIDKSKYCPRCSFNLYYFEERNIWFCGKCAWNFPDELLVKNREQQDPQVNKGVAAPAGTAAAEEVNIPIASKGRRPSLKNKDPWAHLKKDDEVYLKPGVTVVTDVIDIPSGDKEVTSSEDLKKQKIRLRDKTIG